MSYTNEEVAMNQRPKDFTPVPIRQTWELENAREKEEGLQEENPPILLSLSDLLELPF